MVGNGRACEGGNQDVAGEMNVTLTIDNGLITPVGDFIPEFIDDLCAQIRLTKPDFDCSKLIVQTNPGSGPAIITIIVLPPYGNVVGGIQFNLNHNFTFNGSWTQYIDSASPATVSTLATATCSDGSHQLSCPETITTKDSFVVIAAIVAGAVVGVVILVGGFMYWKAHRDEKKALAMSKSKLDSQPSFGGSSVLDANGKPKDVYLYVPSTEGTTQASSPNAGDQTPMIKDLSSPASPGDRTPPHSDGHALPSISEMDSSNPALSPAAASGTTAGELPSNLVSPVSDVNIPNSESHVNILDAHEPENTSDHVDAAAVNVPMETGDEPHQ